MPNEHAKAQRRFSRGLWLTDAGFRGRLRTLPAYHWSTPPCEGEGWRKAEGEGEGEGRGRGRVEGEGEGEGDGEGEGEGEG